MLRGVGKKPDESMVKVCYQVDKQQIGYLRFTLESYDGLGFIRTLDASQGLIELAWPVSREADTLALLATLADEVKMRPVPKPKDYVPI